MSADEKAAEAIPCPLCGSPNKESDEVLLLRVKMLEAANAVMMAERKNVALSVDVERDAEDYYRGGKMNPKQEEIFKDFFDSFREDDLITLHDYRHELVERILAASTPALPGEGVTISRDLFERLTDAAYSDMVRLEGYNGAGYTRYQREFDLAKRTYDEALAILNSTPTPQASTPPASTVEYDAEEYASRRAGESGWPTMYHADLREEAKSGYLAGASRRRVTDGGKGQLVLTDEKRDELIREWWKWWLSDASPVTFMCVEGKKTFELFMMRGIFERLERMIVSAVRDECEGKGEQR